MNGWRKDSLLRGCRGGLLLSKYRRSVRPTHADGYEQEEGAHVSTPLVEE